MMSPEVKQQVHQNRGQCLPHSLCPWKGDRRRNRSSGNSPGSRGGFKSTLNRDSLPQEAPSSPQHRLCSVSAAPANAHPRASTLSPEQPATGPAGS